MAAYGRHAAGDELERKTFTFFSDSQQKAYTRNTLNTLIAPTDLEIQSHHSRKTSIPRSYSMPNVPIPPPMPPSSIPGTPSGTLKRSMAVTGAIAGELLQFP